MRKNRLKTSILIIYGPYLIIRKNIHKCQKIYFYQHKIFVYPTGSGLNMGGSH